MIAEVAGPGTSGEELLHALEQRGVRLWAERERLRFDAPRGVITEPILQRLAVCKAEILRVLEARGADAPGAFPLSTMQQAYWVGQSGALPLCAPARYYLELELRRIPVLAVEQALRRLIARHALLRAVIEPSGQHQVLPEVPALALTAHELAGAATEAARAAIRERMIAREHRPEVWPAFELEVSAAGERMWLHLDVALWLVDGESLRVLLHELLSLCADPEAALSEPRMSYQRYVAAQLARRRGPAYARAWAYWQARLDGFPGAPPLPLARPPESLGTPRFERRCLTLDPAQAGALGQRARAARISQTMALCAAYAQVLAVFGRSKRFVLTVLHSERSAYLPDAAGVVGNFGKTVPLEVDWTEPAPFAARARALQGQLWRDLEHGDVSGVEVGRELARVRGGVGSAAFPITFTAVPPLVPAPEHPLGASLGASIDHRRCHLRVPQVYLDHQVCEGPRGELTLCWDVVDGLFPPGLVDEMFDAYAGLVAGLVEDGAAWEAVAPRVRRRPPASAPAPREPVGLLHEGFAAQVARAPERLAVITPHRQLSYAELDRRAAWLAHRLETAGVRPQELVAVVMEKGWEQVVAVLAILRAGAAYVPIDPGLPAARRALLLEESDCALAVTQPALDTALEWPARVRRLRVEADERGDAPPRSSRPRQGETDLAYVIFTSGTTGKPKGVMIDHRGARNTNDDINRRFGVRPEDRVFGISSLSFDLSVYDIFGALGAGAALVLPEAAQAKDPAHWLALIREHRVTVWSSVPALAQLLEESARAAGGGLAPLRLAMLSGDWIPLGLPDALRARAPGLRVVSLGGATEASIWSVVYEIGDVAPGWRSIPYGTALARQSIHVLDEALDECAPHVAGDIYIGGIGLAQGYLRDAARTAAAFVHHPVTGARLYRTGDLGRLGPDGNVELLGREDHQVKIQGHRIECAEVEAALLATGALAAAVVGVAVDPQGARRLVAHVVPRGGAADGSAPALLERLRQVLPGYMVPSSIVELAALPLTANGKIDRARLPAPAFVAPRTQADRRAPRDDLDRELSALWRELLEAPALGIDDDFFELGGTSFTGMRMLSRLLARTGRSLPLAALIQRPTVAQLADLLRGDAAAPAAPELLVRLGPGGDRPPLFCVHPVGGHVPCYRELARSLAGHGGPAALGIQAPALLGGETFRDIEAMAACYARAIRGEQPQGPYRLGGWSLGGVVAYEIARQLTAAGERVELLLLIDSGFPPLRRPAAPPSDAALMAAFVTDVLAVAGRVAPRLPPPPAAGDLAALAGWGFALLHEHGVPFSGSEELRRSFEMFQANLRALHEHRPRGYAGHPLLFCAGADPAAREAAWAWRQVAPGAEIEELDADHYTIMSGAAVRQIASEVSARLRRADAQEEP